MRQPSEQAKELNKLVTEAIGTAGLWFMIYIVAMTYIGAHQGSQGTIAILSAWYFMSIGYTVIVFSMPTIKTTNWYKVVVQ